jgi:fermentation-respiration switch protein FrsA (DUF1100 family)
VVHGYTDNHICFLNLVRMYRDSLNYNVMVPDLHYHGLSEGRAVQMGWLDRLDVEKFITVAHDIWPNDFMVVHGVSMGGATTMMVSGDETPEYVKAFVDDCGYTSVWDEFEGELQKQFGLPAFPLLYTTSLLCKLRYGWSFDEASAINQVRQSPYPMLFIHGSNDDFVPTAMAYRLYDAKPSRKSLWIAPNAKHTEAYTKYKTEYLSVINLKNP